jgi:arginine/ornithine N-succinyltransferase beta subunit
VQRGLLAPAVVVSAVLMVGTNHSDAWVDVFRAGPTLFVALETLTDATRSEV